MLKELEQLVSLLQVSNDMYVYSGTFVDWRTRTHGEADVFSPR